MVNPDCISACETDCRILINYLIENYPLSKMNPSYEDDLAWYVTELLNHQLQPLIDELPSTFDGYGSRISTLIETICKSEPSYIPRQVEIPQFLCLKSELPSHSLELRSIMDSIMEDTKELPGQMTDGWYKHRNSRITASSAWKIFGSQAQLNSLIYAKCEPKPVGTNGPCMSGPLYHGVKYEDVSIQIYEERFKTKVGEFGCKDHPKHTFLAASPDGINVTPSSCKYGTMVEVKNVVNREITGIPKFEYWIQMQLQMEVFNLPFCDFLETEIREYESYAEFSSDGSFSQSLLGQQKGMVMSFYKADRSLVHEYSELQWTYDQAEEWSKDMMVKHKEDTWISNSYWRLVKILITGVQRNSAWFEASLPYLIKTHETIMSEKESGAYKGRVAKSRKTKVADVATMPSKCIVPGFEQSTPISTCKKVSSNKTLTFDI